MTDKPAAPSRPKPRPKDNGEGGVPVWLPLFAAIIAVAFAVFIATRVFPTLSALISPPEPVLPAGAVLKSQESKGNEVQYLYESALPGCQVAKFFEQAYGACDYDPSSGCNGDTPPRLPNMVSSVARCGGKQSIAQFNVQWYVVIAASADGRSSVFRVYREVN